MACLLRGKWHSGNGRGVYVALDYIPCSKELDATIKGILACASSLFPVELHGASIDLQVSDRKRLMPLPLTFKCKGRNTEARPHRQVDFVCADTVERVGMEGLTALLDRLVAALTPEQREAAAKHLPERYRPARLAGRPKGHAAERGEGASPFEIANGQDPDAVCEWLGILAGGKVTCPGCGESAGVTILHAPEYRAGLKCHHDHCAGKGKDGFRTLVDLVAEVRGVESTVAANLMAEHFGFEGIRARRAARLRDGGAAPAPVDPTPLIEALPETLPDGQAGLEQLAPVLAAIATQPELAWKRHIDALAARHNLDRRVLRRSVKEAARGEAGDCEQDVEGAFFSSDERDLPVVKLGLDHVVANDAIIAALAAEPDIYQRGTYLARAMQHGTGQGRQLKLEALPEPSLGEILSARVRLQDGDGDPTHPPPQTVHEIHARHHWPGVRPITGIVEYPVLRPDGTVLQTPGYDQATGLLYRPNAVFDQVPENPSAADAKESLAALDEVVRDFPFAEPMHKSAHHAATLTMVGRFAIDGPTPLFLWHANTRGTGKDLGAEAAIRLVTGRPLGLSGLHRKSPEEQCKEITTLSMSGRTNAHMGNVRGSLNSDTLERVLTATWWSDRILGGNTDYEGPWTCVLSASGNNVEVAGDLVRRTIQVRLHTDMEKPEEREDFLHDPLIPWVMSQRHRLVPAALTILRAYVVADRPAQKGTRLGSYEAWAGLVAAALVWAGLPSPVATQEDLDENSSSELTQLRALVSAWLAALGERAVTVAELLEELPSDKPTIKAGDEDASIPSPKLFQLRNAIIDIAKSKDGNVPKRVALGQLFGRIRGRVATIEAGQYRLTGELDRNSVTHWQLQAVVAQARTPATPSAEPRAGVAGVCGGCQIDEHPQQNPNENADISVTAGDAGVNLTSPTCERDHIHSERTHKSANGSHFSHIGESTPIQPPQHLHDGKCATNSGNSSAGVGQKPSPADTRTTSAHPPQTLALPTPRLRLYAGDVDLSPDGTLTLHLADREITIQEGATPRPFYVALHKLARGRYLYADVAFQDRRLIVMAPGPLAVAPALQARQ